MQKILILDGIEQVPLGRQYYKALKNQGADVNLVDLKKLKRKRFYKIKRLLAKHIITRPKKDEYFYFPKVSDKVIKKLITTEKPTTVLIIGFSYAHISDGLLASLKDKFGFNIALMDSDSGNFSTKLDKFKFFINREINQSDITLNFSKRMSEYLKEIKSNTDIKFFPFGSDKIKLKHHQKKSGLFFVGFPDIRRLFHLEHLRNSDINVYGEVWKRYATLTSPALQSKMITKNIWGSELHSIMQQSKIVLNINQGCWANLDTGINLRVYEALAAKCFLLTDYCEELNELFVIGEEIETFKTMEELAEKTKYYLEHDEERERIAQKGHEKFLKQFTYEQRAKALLDIIQQQ